MSPLSFDLKGNQISNVWSSTERMKNIYVSIFPENGKTYILISWLKEDSCIELDKFRNQFNALKNDGEILLRVLNNMVACQTDNIVFSKKLLDKWGKEKREFFLVQLGSIFWNLNGKNVGLLIEKNLMQFKCKFDLFEEI